MPGRKLARSRGSTSTSLHLLMIQHLDLSGPEGLSPLSLLELMSVERGAPGIGAGSSLNFLHGRKKTEDMKLLKHLEGARETRK